MKPASPNQLSHVSQLRLLRFGGADGAQVPDLLRALCVATEGVPGLREHMPLAQAAS
jgi:hypothetical protein